MLQVTLSRVLIASLSTAAYMNLSSFAADVTQAKKPVWQTRKTRKRTKLKKWKKK
jgi:hypothetical protein